MNVKVQLLTSDEEKALIARAAAGDRRAEERVIIAHTPLVKALVAKVARSGVPREELEQQGMLGLVEALRRFDASIGAPFNAFARRYVLHELHTLCAQVSKAVSLPKTASMKKVAMHYRRRRAAAESVEGGVWDDAARQAMAADLGVRRADIRDYELVHENQTESLQAHEAAGIEYGSGEDVERDVLARLDLARDKEWLRIAIAKLSPTKRRVIERTISDHDTDEIAAELRLTRADVLDIVAAASADLRFLIEDGELPSGPAAPALAPDFPRVVEQGTLFAGVEVEGIRLTETVVVVRERRRRSRLAKQHGHGMDCENSDTDAGRKSNPVGGCQADQIWTERESGHSGLFAGRQIPWHRSEDENGTAIAAAT